MRSHLTTFSHHAYDDATNWELRDQLNKQGYEDAIAPRVKAIDLLTQVDLQKLAVDDLKDLICVAQQELNSREQAAE